MNTSEIDWIAQEKPLSWDPGAKLTCQGAWAMILDPRMPRELFYTFCGMTRADRQRMADFKAWKVLSIASRVVINSLRPYCNCEQRCLRMPLVHLRSRR